MKINFEIIRQGAEFLHRLVYTYQISPFEVTGFNEDRSYEYACRNDIPFIRGWPTFYKTLEKTSLQNRIGIAALPHADGQPASSVLGGWNLMISRHSKVKREAAIFLNHMLSPEVQKIMLKVGGYLPVVRDIYTDPDILAEIDYLPYLKQLVDKGFYRPAGPQYIQLSKSLADSIYRYLNRPVNPNEGP